MKTRFKSEKAAREETIGRAAEMARAAVEGNRHFSDREQRKVSMLLAIAEAHGLGKDIPTDPAKLLEFAGLRAETPGVSITEILADSILEETPPRPAKKKR